MWPVCGKPCINVMPCSFSFLQLPDDRNNAAIIKETSFSMSFSLNNVNLSNNSVNVNEVHFENIGNVAPQPNSQDNTSLMSWLIILTIMVTIIGVTAVFVVLKIRGTSNNVPKRLIPWRVWVICYETWVAHFNGDGMSFSHGATILEGSSGLENHYFQKISPLSDVRWVCMYLFHACYSFRKFIPFDFTKRREVVLKSEGICGVVKEVQTEFSSSWYNAAVYIKA